MTRAGQLIVQFRAMKMDWDQDTDQCFVVNLLSDELVLTKRIAGLSCDGVNGALLHLLLDGTVQHEQRFSRTLLHKQ